MSKPAWDLCELQTDSETLLNDVSAWKEVLNRLYRALILAASALVLWSFLFNWVSDIVKSFLQVCAQSLNLMLVYTIACQSGLISTHTSIRLYTLPGWQSFSDFATNPASWKKVLSPSSFDNTVSELINSLHAGHQRLVQLCRDWCCRRPPWLHRDVCERRPPWLQRWHWRLPQLLGDWRPPRLQRVCWEWRPVWLQIWYWMPLRLLADRRLPQLHSFDRWRRLVQLQGWIGWLPQHQGDCWRPLRLLTDRRLPQLHSSDRWRRLVQLRRWIGWLSQHQGDQRLF